MSLKYLIAMITVILPIHGLEKPREIRDWADSRKFHEVSLRKTILANRIPLDFGAKLKNRQDFIKELGLDLDASKLICSGGLNQSLYDVYKLSEKTAIIIYYQASERVQDPTWLVYKCFVGPIRSREDYRSALVPHPDI